MTNKLFKPSRILLEPSGGLAHGTSDYVLGEDILRRCNNDVAMGQD